MSHLFRKKSYSSFEKPSQGVVSTTIEAPSPDPNNYIINKSLQEGEYLILDITYPECKNFEGRKILIFKGVDIASLLKQKAIDPHFLEDDRFISPIARFSPTKEGWQMALTLTSSLNMANESKPEKTRKP